MSSKLIDIFAGTTTDFFASNGKLEHNSAILALFLSDLRRWDFVDSLAAGALDLLGSGDELEHGPAVVADEVGSGHWGDARGD